MKCFYIDCKAAATHSVKRLWQIPADANAAHRAELTEDRGMRLVCSWCSRVVRDVRGAQTSHVLCAFCAQRLLEEDRSPK